MLFKAFTSFLHLVVASHLELLNQLAVLLQHHQLLHFGRSKTSPDKKDLSIRKDIHLITKPLLRHNQAAS